jgi:protein involved in polysaccharide export with SLBB domain
MSPEEIDAKIKSLGMTREEAEKRAKENGIDLQSFLRGSGGSAAATTAPGQLLESGPTAGPTVDSAQVQTIGSSREFPTSRGLKYFGYEVFSATPSSFEPSAAGPIDPDYIIGPEDMLRVSIWGQVEQQNELTVDKEGRIFIPSAGPIVVTGQTVDQVNKTLTKQLSRSIQGLSATPKTVWLDVTLAKIRPKRIFIMGEVNNPGGYTVNSYSTIFNSLFAVGGPTVNGSLREVRLIRDNKIVAKLDLYLYLTGAEKNNDVRVQNNDIIYVPVRKNTVHISGEIRRPGVYELLPGENLKKLIEVAGGTLSSTYLERIQVERIIPMTERKKNDLERRYMDINYRELKIKGLDFSIVDGDYITLFPILDEVKNFVTINGAVFKPGLYQLTPNLRLRDLILLADSLRPDAYLIRGELIRFLDDERSKISLPFDLRALMDKNQSINITLKPKDEIIIHTIDVRLVHDQFVEIFGAIKRPGRYLLTQNMKLIDLIMVAEGYTEPASILEAEIARMEKTKNADTLTYIKRFALPDITDTISITNFEFYERYRESDFSLQHRDQVFVRPNPYFKIQQLVSIQGEVNHPGEYALITHNEYLSDIIQRAGGLTAAAYLRGGKITRKDDRVNIDFQDVMDTPKSKLDLILHSGDVIEIPKKPNFVKMIGEVNNAGLLGFSEGQKLWTYIDNAGGLTDSADYVILFHPNGNAEKFRTGWFSGNSIVYDGSTIYVSKKPAPREDKTEIDIGNLIRDIFAITASALTVLVLSRQL